MMLLRAFNIIRFHALTRRHIVASGSASIRPLPRLITGPVLSLRFKTTPAKTEGPEPAQKPSSSSSILLYHAGTVKISFLGWMKLSTLFIFAFFGFIVTPAYYKKEGLSPTVARTAFCAVAPVVLVAYITSPFVTFVKVRAPPFTRQSTEAMKRYLQNPANDPLLEINTMSFIAKPRTSLVRLSELKPVNKRFGLVNVARDTAAENAKRKWYMFRAVGNFYIPPQQGSERYLWPLLWEKRLARGQ